MKSKKEEIFCLMKKGGSCPGNLNHCVLLREHPDRCPLKKAMEPARKAKDKYFKEELKKKTKPAVFIDYAVTENCQNLKESYGEICVKCNKCGRFDKKKKTP